MNAQQYIKTLCPFCDGPIEFPEHGVGEMIDCPHCGEKIELALPKPESKDTDSGASWGCIFMVIMMLYGLAQIYAGFIGIRHHCGAGWAIAAVFAVFWFRFSLPLTIGSFFGAKNVWGWHWLGALFFAAPGLAFMALMLPGVMAYYVTKIRR